MHLHHPDIQRYLDGELDESTAAAMDAQASVSLPWTLLLANRAMDQTRWERRGLLGRLVRVE
jgi:predicted alpha/beta-fold hydrolase